MSFLESYWRYILKLLVEMDSMIICNMLLFFDFRVDTILMRWICLLKDFYLEKFDEFWIVFCELFDQRLLFILDALIPAKS
jgi:hypothetical protein